MKMNQYLFHNTGVIDHRSQLRRLRTVHGLQRGAPGMPSPLFISL